jgi:hypothetical protein
MASTAPAGRPGAGRSERRPLDAIDSKRPTKHRTVLHAEVPGRLKGDTINHFKTESIAALGDNRCRIAVKPRKRGKYLRSVEVGDRYRQQTRVDRATLAHTSLSGDITYQRITSYASTGSVYAGQRNERLNILECKALIAPGRWQNANWVPMSAASPLPP